MRSQGVDHAMRITFTAVCQGVADNDQDPWHSLLCKLIKVPKLALNCAGQLLLLLFGELCSTSGFSFHVGKPVHINNIAV